MKRYIQLFIFSWFSLICFSQTVENSDSDIDFLFYLFEGRKYDEIILLFDQMSENTKQKDSTRYILGMTYYYRQELDQSAYHLSMVSKSSVFYDPSVFFRALDYAHLGDYSKSQTILENYSSANVKSDYDELLAVEFAGLALLQRDFEMFDHHAKKFKFEQYYYTNSQNQLMNIRKTLDSFNRKSMFMAGAFSAVVPGAGKMYAGKIGEGVATFITMGGLAAVTAENWVKNGFVDWKTITFGTIGTIFYIGNIYGSVASIKVYRNQFNDQQNNTILLGIHLPVRSLFR